MRNGKHWVNPSFHPFRERRITYHGLVEYPDDWLVKSYGICIEDRAPTIALMSRAKEISRQCIEEIEPPHAVYGLGVTIAHEAIDGDFIVFFWWTGENMIASRAFYSTKGENTFIDVVDSHITACVWELEIIQFERQCWIDTVMKRAEAPDFAGYATRALKKPLGIDSSRSEAIK